MTNCPNCGAPVTAHICEYCGTTLSNKHSSVDFDNKCNELLKAKTRRLIDSSQLTTIYEKAIRAMRRYGE